MTQFAILGAGMAGFGAASKFGEFGITPVVYEKQPYVGGHAASFKSNGYIFDDGPHISFTKNKRIQKIFSISVNQKFETLKALANNYWRGYWIKHPAQCNLYGLPKDLVIDILYDFITAQTSNSSDIKSYKDWLYAGFGKTFAELFPMEYGKKFHTTTADNMTADWIGVRLYKADLREVLQGALSPNTPDVHYVKHFRYPSRGGFVSYLNSFSKETRICLNHELIKLDLEKKQLHFRNNETTPYDYIISSLPLPELIPKIKGVPNEVFEASKKLACTTCVIVNIGVNRNNISKAYWTYFYDKDIVFTRLSFPHMQSPHNAPPGAGSIQAEIYYSRKYRCLNLKPASFIQPVIRDLMKCGILNVDDRILFSEARRIPYANVIFDLERERALPKIHEFLNAVKVFYCGRFGEWGYHWTDESFISGEEAAKKVIDLL